MTYEIKDCAECGAPFAPTSGRQRYCPFHRGAKFVSARDTESKRTRRTASAATTAEQATRPPHRLALRGEHLRHERTEWIGDALRLARRLHRKHRLGLAQIVVGWAERTANGEVKLLGCHHLGSLVDDLDFRLRMSEIASQVQSHAEANADKIVSLPPAETPPEMSVSRVVV